MWFMKLRERIQHFEMYDRCERMATVCRNRDSSLSEIRPQLSYSTEVRRSTPGPTSALIDKEGKGHDVYAFM
jgi:hypothetical protein